MLGAICTWIVASLFLGYLIPHCFVSWFFKTKNLKRAYNAEWALVTGSSSGERACQITMHEHRCGSGTLCSLTPPLTLA